MSVLVGKAAIASSGSPIPEVSGQAVAAIRPKTTSAVKPNGTRPRMTSTACANRSVADLAEQHCAVGERQSAVLERRDLPSQQT